MRPTDRKIYLASKSPRRRELLRQVGIDFELLLFSQNPEDGETINEAVLPEELPHDYVRRISREKADVAFRLLKQRRLLSRPILTADTTVVLHDKILGKPRDKKEAQAMLRALSGQTHKVLTCVTVQAKETIFQELQESEVTFSALSDDIIEHYCETAEPYDKAGGYGIQGLAAKFITHISGSYSGIAGLPLYETTRLLQKTGMDIS